MDFVKLGFIATIFCFFVTLSKADVSNCSCPDRVEIQVNIDGKIKSGYPIIRHQTCSIYDIYTHQLYNIMYVCIDNTFVRQKLQKYTRDNKKKALNIVRKELLELELTKEDKKDVREYKIYNQSGNRYMGKIVTQW